MFNLVIFDFDGTLTAPGGIDFAAIRRDIECPPTTTILEYLDTLEAEIRETAEATVNAHELVAAAAARPNHGAEDTVLSLRRSGIRTAIITRNNRQCFDRSLDNFTTLTPAHFEVIITRDDDLPVKPHPAGIIHAAARVDVQLDAVLMVGDYLFDIECGRAAGVTTIWLRSDHCIPTAEDPPDHIIDHLPQLVAIAIP
jgi:HAD superfamily hydrolase (TIGR01509 family)